MLSILRRCVLTSVLNTLRMMFASLPGALKEWAFSPFHSFRSSTELNVQGDKQIGCLTEGTHNLVGRKRINYMTSLRPSFQRKEEKIKVVGNAALGEITYCAFKQVFIHFQTL